MMAKRKSNKAFRKAIKPVAVPRAANDDATKKPTTEREKHNRFRSVGMAMQVIPVINELLRDRVLNQAEYDALNYYRDQASLADKSPVRSQCDFSVGGGDYRAGVAIMSASLETGRMEAGFGALWALARAVCVDDVTLEEWVIGHGGGIETANGIEAQPFAVGIATMELKYAAGSVVR